MPDVDPTPVVAPHALDNRSCNLRWVTPKENTLNRAQSPRKSKSGFRGVTQFSKNCWAATCKGKKLGYFATAELAAKAYDNVALTYWGTDAVLNSCDSLQLHG